MKLHLAFVVVIATFFFHSNSQAQTFQPTSGPQVWNDNNNWGPSPPQPYPNAMNAAAVLSAPTGDPTIDLVEPTITVGSLTVGKAASGDFDTTITGSGPSTLIFHSAGTAALINSNGASAGGTGATVIDAPIQLNSTLKVTQNDNDELRFNQNISGSGALNIVRDLANSVTDAGVVSLGAANTYTGATQLGVNSAVGATNFLVVLLTNANSIPGGIGLTGGTSHLTITQSTIIGLGAGDFRRGQGINPDQFSFSNIATGGFAAFGADRVVNIGNSATLSWNASFIGQNNSLALGAETADATVEFQNNINLLSGVARTIRSIDGSAPIDGKMTGILSSSGVGSFTKTGSGTLSLANANTYTGTTTVDGGVLRLDHVQALPGGPLKLMGGGVLALGVGDFARTVGIGAGQVQFADSGSGTNAKNSGFAAAGATRTVLLNGGTTLTWAVDFVPTGGNFILSDTNTDGMLVFQNPINLTDGDREFAGRDGTADIDARLTAEISGGTGSAFTKTQAGTLELAAANSYDGATTIKGGVLLLTDANSIPGGIEGGNAGNISFNGNNARIGLGAGNFTTPIGTGAGQVQFVAGQDGGFAAYGDNREVNFGGNASPNESQVVWDTTGFAPATLMFGAVGADRTVNFRNPIDLNNAATPRIVATRDGPVDVEGILSGVISGSGGLQKSSPGVLALTGANTYDGGTIVAEGTLLVNNSTGSSGVGIGDVTVNNGAILGGSGFVGSLADTSNVNVSTGGHIAPGNSAGELTVTGDVTFAIDSFLDIELAGLTEGTEYDKLSVDGMVTLGGDLNVTLLSFSPEANNSFEILYATDGVTGLFALENLPPLSGGLTWDVDYNPNSVVLNVVAPGVPGDHNKDGMVDAADYVAWRKNPGGFGGDPDGYDDWRENFGAGDSGSGGSSNGSESVPEPTTHLLLLLTTSLLLRRKRLNSYAS